MKNVFEGCKIENLRIYRGHTYEVISQREYYLSDDSGKLRFMTEEGVWRTIDKLVKNSILDPEVSK
jgi:hypothetical protein